MMDHFCNNFWYGLLAIVLSTLACSPVIAISWNEFLIISVFVAVLLGPPLYRFIRRVEQFLRREKKDKS
jgi:asparagine N-glycosylation enzyme membrane subunit Stt3